MILLVKHCEEDPKCLYLKEYGPHFNKELSEFAISLMDHPGKSNLSYEQVINMLSKYKIDIEYPYDAYYVANMGYHDFYKSSIKDEEHLAQFVQDYLEDEDGYDGIAFYRWLLDMHNRSKEIDWNDMI